MDSLTRDQNRIPAIGAESTLNREILTAKIDPVTGRLLVDSKDSSLTDGSQIAQILKKYETNDIESASSTFTYLGFEDKDGNWYIKTIDSSVANAFRYATILNNPEYSDYISAWSNKDILTYGYFSEAF